jgi:glycosyltransferase involved in cell wall biosynthesis
MRKILFITTVFPPLSSSGVQRVVRLLKKLPDIGYMAVVITALPNSSKNLSSMDEIEYTGELYRVPENSIRGFVRWIFGIFSISSKIVAHNSTSKGKDKKKHRINNVLRKLASQFFDNVIEVPDKYTLWIWPAIRQGNILLKHYNFHCVYATAPSISALIVGAFIARRGKIPLILEFRDLWVDNPWGIKYWRFRRYINLLIEKWLVNQAASIVTISSGSQKIITKRYDKKIGGKLAVVSHGFDPEEFETIMPNKHFQCLPLRLTYTGHFYGGRRDITGFFKAIQLLIVEKIISPDDILIHVAGDAGYVIETAERFGLSSIVNDHGRIPHTKALQLQAESHLLLLVEAAEDSDWVYSNLPGKLFEYLGANRPIMALINPCSIMADILRKTQTGCIIHPSDVDEISKYLEKQIMQLRNSLDLDYRPNYQEIEKYHWSKLTKQIALILNSFYKT